MRLARRMLAAGLFDSTAAAAVEANYLQFDPTASDYGVAPAVFGGISNDYSIAIKVATKNTAGSSTATYFAAGGVGATNENRRDSAYAGTSFANTFLHGITEGGTTAYNKQATSIPGDAAARVFAIKRDQSENDAFTRIIKASGVDFSSDDTSATHEIPDHIAVGAMVNAALSPTAATYGNLSLIGLVLVAGLPSDAELTNWLNGTDARDHISNIDHYWVASDLADGGTGGITSSITPLVGSVPLNCYGPVVADLVAWP